MSKRITSLEINKIKNLILEDVPIRTISKKLKLPLSTTHYHVRKINPKFNLIKKPVIKLRTFEDIGEVLGVFSGDGSITSKYYNDVVISIGIKESVYLKRLVKFLTRIFDKPPWIYNEYKESVTRVRYRSKLILNFFKENLVWKTNKTKELHLKKRVKNKSFGVGFLRGLMDTDGYITKEVNRAVFNTISKELMKDIEFYLRQLNIDFKTRLQKDKRRHQSDIYRIKIMPYHIIKFLKIIKPRKLNGAVV